MPDVMLAWHKEKMRKNIKKIVSTMLVCSMVTFASTDLVSAAAGYYNEYSDVKSCSDDSKKIKHHMQGAAIDRKTNKMYVMKTSGDETVHQLLSYDLNSDSKAVATPVTLTVPKGTLAGDSSSKSVFSHANDITVVNENNETYIYVATFNNTNESQVVRLKVGKSGTYSIADICEVKIDNKRIKVGSIAHVQGNEFILRDGGNVYLGNFVTTNSSTHKATKTFQVKKKMSLNFNSVKINGTAVDINFDKSKVEEGKKDAYYERQGMAYYKGNLYVPLWNATMKRQSVVLVYKVDTTLTTLNSTSNLSFRITSSVYKNLFEFESVDIDSKGELYFAANRTQYNESTKKEDQKDCIGRFKEFNANK